MSLAGPDAEKKSNSWLIGRVAILAALAVVTAVLGYRIFAQPSEPVPAEIRFYLERGIAPAPAEVEAAAALVERTRAATFKYRNVEEALADGYFDSTPMQPGVHHWMNLVYMSDGRVLDPEKPENLMYYQTSDGRQVFVGVMYLMQAPGEPGPAIGGPMTVWHLHPAYCWVHLGFPVSPSSLDPDRRCPPGQLLADTPEMIHVWVVDNPAGVFAEDMDLPEPPA
jgi:hypothetical protein